MDLIINQSWLSTGSSGGMAAIEVPISAAYTVMYIDHSTLATTQSFSYQSAKESTGPWFIEGSTQISTAVSTRFSLRVTGPVGSFVRPYLHTASTGLYNVQLIGVG